MNSVTAVSRASEYRKPPGRNMIARAKWVSLVEDFGERGNDLLAPVKVPIVLRILEVLQERALEDRDNSPRRERDPCVAVLR